MSTKTRKQRRATKRGVPCYLFVVPAAKLSQLQLTLETMPLCAHGRVFVFADSPAAVPVVGAPARFCVTVHSSERVAEAVNAWAAEMLCGSPSRIIACIDEQPAVAEELKQQSRFEGVELEFAAI